MSIPLHIFYMLIKKTSKKEREETETETETETERKGYHIFRFK
jgi:hypothetical protein